MNLFAKPKRWTSKKWRDAAKGQLCTMRLPLICNGNPETTVLAHANGAGMAVKASDHDSADMCAACHDAFDGRTNHGISKAEMREQFERARYLTIVNRLERGIVR